MNNDTRPTHLDWCSGIGGFALAFEAAGFRTVGFAEIKPSACEVLRKHWPDVPNYGDVESIDAGRILKASGNVNVLTGGFPCQPFSIAGERRGDSDERFLWPSFVRGMREIRPDFALFENVPGILTIDGGRTFNRIVSDLSTLEYDCLWNLLPACAIGAPHERDRVWIVAHSKRERLPRHFQNSRVSRKPATPYAKFGDDGIGIRNTLEHFGGGIRRGDGVSVAMVRDEVEGYGNAIVPQVAYIFAQAIYKQLRP